VPVEWHAKHSVGGGVWGSAGIPISSLRK
jgi:hypothetical protein